MVQPGDTLIGIAERHFANPRAWPVVQSRNRIVDPHKIPAGARLKIPAALLRTFPVSAEVLLVNGQVNRVDAAGRAGERLIRRRLAAGR